MTSLNKEDFMQSAICWQIFRSKLKGLSRKGRNVKKHIITQAANETAKSAVRAMTDLADPAEYSTTKSTRAVDPKQVVCS